MDSVNQPWPDPAAIITFEEGDPHENPWVMGKPKTEAIEIQAYSSEWAKQFETSRDLIARALPRIALSIEHIGSTAIPELPAKPVIDIDLIVADPDQEEDYVPVLNSLGYELTVREKSWYRHRMLRHDMPRVNLHVFGPACPEHYRHLLFRDWLRVHPEDRARYADAKRTAKEGADTVQNYNQRKQAVVRDIYQAIFQHRGWITPPKTSHQ